MSDQIRLRRSPVTVASLLETAYRRYTEHPALVHHFGTLTYAELGERVHRLGSALSRIGARHGDRVVILSANSPEFIEISHAAFTGGFVRVTPSAKLHIQEIAGILQDCAARFVFLGPDWAAAAPALRQLVPSLEHVIAVGDTAADALAYEQLITDGSPERPEREPTPEDLAALLYTSGTTGRPKGAMLTHANWAAMIRNSMIELPPIGNDEIVLHVAPLSHFSGYVEPTYTARGAMHVIGTPFQPESTLAAVGRDKITVMPLVPTMVNMLLPAAESGQFDLSSLRCVVYGGSGIAPDRLARATRVFGPVLVQFFGLSETPMPLAALSVADHAFDGEAPVSERLASAGRISPFVELEIRDASEKSVEAEQVGEITVRGDVVMAGYWNEPGQTAEMIDADGWARTGDLGRIDHDGYLYIVDRKRDMIVTGGYNVYPTEVENAIASLSEVQEVAVIGTPDEQWGESITAVVVPRKGATLDADMVVGACQARLASYKKPRRVDFVDELPKTGSGKVMRRTIREGYWANHPRTIG